MPPFHFSLSSLSWFRRSFLTPPARPSDFSPRAQTLRAFLRLRVLGVDTVWTTCSASLPFSPQPPARGQVLPRQGWNACQRFCSHPGTGCYCDAAFLWISEGNQETWLNSVWIVTAKSPPWEPVGSKLQAGSLLGKWLLIRHHSHWPLEGKPSARAFDTEHGTPWAPWRKMMLEEVGWGPVSARTGSLLTRSQVDILGEKYKFITWEKTAF